MTTVPPPIPSNARPSVATHEPPQLPPSAQLPIRHKKSVPLAIALAILGGPSGLIYSSPWLGLALCVPAFIAAWAGAVFQILGFLWLISIVMSVVISRERNTTLGPAAQPPRLLRDLGTGLACVLGLWMTIGAISTRRQTQEAEKPTKIVGSAYEVDPPRSDSPSRGLSPQLACSLLPDLPVTSPYHDMEDGYGCLSTYHDLPSAGAMKNNLAYYVSGSPSAARNFKVVLNVHDKRSEKDATWAFIKQCNKLISAVAGVADIPTGFADAIRQRIGRTWTFGNAKVALEYDGWPTGKGYDFRCIVSL